jgi:outer membrane protein
MDITKTSSLSRRILVFSTLLFSFGILPLHAQDLLTLEDCLDLARKQGLQYKSLQRNLAISYEALRAAQAPFNLQADMSLSLPSYSESRGLNNNDAFVSRIREESTSFNNSGSINFGQNIPHMGRINLSTSGNRSESNSSRRVSFVDFSGSVSLNYTLDLLRRDPNVVALEQAERSFNQGRLTFQSEDLLFETSISGAYYNLVSAINSFEIQEKNYNQSLASLELAQKKYDIGLIAEVEAMRLQVDLLSAQAGWEAAQINIERSRDSFREILGMDLDEPFEIVTDLEDIDFERYPISMERAIEVGLRKNTNLQASKIAQELSEIQFEETKRDQYISARLSTSVSFSGQGEQIGDISQRFERNSISTGISISLPLIDDGSRRSSLRLSELNMEQSRLSMAALERSITRQIKAAVYAVQQSESQIDIFEAGLDVAERTYQVEQNRFDLGLVDSQFLLTAQENVTASRLAALNAVLGYKRALVSLRVLTNSPLEDLVEKDLGE